MKFNPNQEQKPKVELLEGEATFEVIRAEELLSKSSGGEMIKCIYKIWDCKGNEGILSDHFPASVPWKLKQFFAACNRLDDFKKGEVSPGMFSGMSGKCHLKYDVSTQYGKQTKIKDYIEAEAKESGLPNFDEKDKDIPF